MEVDEKSDGKNIPFQIDNQRKVMDEGIIHWHYRFNPINPNQPRGWHNMP